MAWAFWRVRRAGWPLLIAVLFGALSGSAVAFVWLILATLPTRARNRGSSTARLGVVELGEKHEQAVREALERFPRDFPDDPRQEQIKALGYAPAKRLRGRSPRAQLRALAPVTSEAALEGVPALPESANAALARLYSHCRVSAAGVLSSFARGPPSALDLVGVGATKLPLRCPRPRPQLR